ncbi:hypothetical protein LRP49_02175 [Enterovibrio sp. ZSDZ35]|uniref:Lipoprotein n=1 Tax=Enterovibrio qingdaonensis TaxID=2899818 RepID=A0ABT5QG93_9GAMM|nr:hypothetical protein [Enterovibrio sp. ZSDZ35]MDD1779994.1 hypothetical protein [Enterovibrio sp. ZSDZ35]
MKRISLLPLLIVFLSGCNSEDSPSTNSPDSPPSVPPQAVSLADSVKKELELSYSRNEPQLDRTSSLEGKDEDGNGVRDDIDLIIADTNADDAVKKALTQTAKALQDEMKVDWDSLSETEAKDAIRELSSTSVKSHQCMAETLGSGFSRTSKTLQALTFNTKARTLHYLKGNNVADGMAFSIGDHDNACE